MAEASSFPQIPTTVWWGVRDILSKTPKVTLNENFLAVQLNVQKTAAKQYVTELRRVGMLSDENKATELALKWRMDDSYRAAVSEFLNRCYGEELIALAPTVADRERAVSWFKMQGLGEGSARNKAATYFLIASPEPGESPTRSSAGTASIKTTTPKAKVFEKAGGGATETESAGASNTPNGHSIFPVNLNLQIHISADASTDQIEAIFSSMRKHLGNARLS